MVISSEFLKNNVFPIIEKVKKFSYCPYSKFVVVAIIFLKNKKFLSGVNIENASFGETICAEKSALAQFYSLGYKKKEIEAFFVFADSSPFTYPCGGCCQVMMELIKHDVIVYLINNKYRIKKVLTKKLLNNNFSFSDR